ncbi:MAG: hypothetical protein JWO18_185, partial [Microbacteriaceae bacterium]|nr:hypothetical protein [Microbacteriaceae bacterium]
STWLRAGIPVNQVSQWLGHANPNTTLKIYAHVLGEEQDTAAIARLDAIDASRTDPASYQQGPDQPTASGPSI